jgi:glycosyltransferase involved in cell wall biosynthesis
MKNLLILLDADFVGGAETNYKYLLPILKKEGWTPIFVTNGAKNLKEYFHRQNIQVQVLSPFKNYYSLSENGRFSAKNFFKNLLSIKRNKSTLKKIIDEYKPAAVISNSMISHWLLSSVRHKHPFKKVMHLGDIINRKRVFGLYGMGLDRITKRMDSVIVVSDAVKKSLIPKIHNKVTKLYNPVEMKIQGRKMNGKSVNHTIRVGMFARYTSWKGHREFLKIANELNDPIFEFVCYGNVDGNEDYFRELQRLANSLPNKDRIHLNGFSHDVVSEMSKCDLILHLSNLPEPFGRIFIEANALGIPAYAYDGGGTREVFKELKIAGVLITNGDYKKMVEEVRLFPDKKFEFPSLEEISPENYFSRFEKVLLS